MCVSEWVSSPSLSLESPRLIGGGGGAFFGGGGALIGGGGGGAFFGGGGGLSATLSCDGRTEYL